jgi:hypothetical protein
MLRVGDLSPIPIVTFHIPEAEIVGQDNNDVGFCARVLAGRVPHDIVGGELLENRGVLRSRWSGNREEREDANEFDGRCNAQLQKA